MLPVVVKLADDKAWRVRWCLTHKLHEIGKMALSLPTTDNYASGGQFQSKCITVEPENYTNIQITIVNSIEVIVDNLLNDQESEVRSAAAANVHQCCRLFRKDRVIDVVIPCIQKLANDQSSEYVRTSIALSINELSVVLGKEATVEYLLPQLLVLLRDPASPVSPSVCCMHIYICWCIYISQLLLDMVIF